MKRMSCVLVCVSIGISVFANGTNETKRELVVFYHEIDGFRFREDQEIHDIVDRYYEVKRVRLSAEYDEAYFRDIYNTQRRLGNWSLSLSFEEYLKIKDRPIDRNSRRLISRFGLTQTPQLVITDEGRVIDHYTSHHTIWLIYHLSELSEADLDALMWDIQNPEDRESLLDFLVRNAR